MKTLSAALQAHLDTGSTTMVYCWRITRQDGLVQGFTEHDNDLTFDSTTFEASTGFTATQMSMELGLSVDNLNAEGALSSDSINEDDLAAGYYDAATAELFWVNFEDVAERVTMLKGSIGEVKRGELAFSTELRSLTHLLQQETGRTYRRFCDAKLGDERCAPNGEINLADSQWSSSGTISSVSGNRILTVTGLAPNSDSFYALGYLTFTSGANNNQSIPVKLHSVSAGITRVTLWEVPAFPVSASDTFNIFAGCDKRFSTCVSKFSNSDNFRGFPHIPGNDALQRYAKQGAADNDGSSRVTS